MQPPHVSLAGARVAALGSDTTPPLVPGIDEPRVRFVLKPCGHSIDVDGEHGASTSTWEPHTAPYPQDKRRRCAQPGWAGHPAVACAALEHCQWGFARPMPLHSPSRRLP